MPAKPKPPGHPLGTNRANAVHSVRKMPSGHYGLYRIDFTGESSGTKGKLLDYYETEQAAEAEARRLNEIAARPIIEAKAAAKKQRVKNQPSRRKAK